MSGGSTVSEQGRDGDDPFADRLLAKSEICELLFGDWRHGRRQDTSAARMLTYSPSDGDTLTTVNSENADIFSTSRWAAKRAHEVFRTTIKSRALFERLRLPEPDAPDMDDLVDEEASQPDTFDKLEIVIVGSSVAGLVFHGTLIYLFDVWHKQTNAEFGLNDYFTFRFLDSHKRPLQKLRQARDRRIIPRFEFERILDVDKAELTPELYKRPDPKEVREQTNEPLSEDETAFLTAWNEHDTIEEPEFIVSNKTDYGVRYLPEELCWEAGTVRHVADQIHDGYKKLTTLHKLNWTFDTFSGVEPGHSTTGGHLFRSAQSREHGFANDGVRRRVGLWTSVNMGRDPSLTCDFVLLATGPGVDVSPSGLGETNDKRRLHENTQSSYWNTPKIELDVVESDDHNVLVLGHRDSAAGSIYSNLFNDPEACSHRFLTQLLKGSEDHRIWFTRLKEAVKKYRDETDQSVTSYWKNALAVREVQETLFSFPLSPKATKNKPGSDVSNDQLRTLLRSYVTVSLVFRAKDADEERGIKEFKIRYKRHDGEPPTFLDCSRAGELWHDSERLQDHLFEKAWPENRIVMALLSPHILVFQENGTDHESLIETCETGTAKQTKMLGENATNTFRYSVPLYSMRISYPAPGENLPRDKLLTPVTKTFKYVLDCRGGKFSSRFGNFHCYIPQAV